MPPFSNSIFFKSEFVNAVSILPSAALHCCVLCFCLGEFILNWASSCFIVNLETWIFCFFNAIYNACRNLSVSHFCVTFFLFEKRYFSCFSIDLWYSKVVKLDYLQCEDELGGQNWPLPEIFNKSWHCIDFFNIMSRLVSLWTETC